MKMPDARVKKAQREAVFSHSVLFSVVIPLYNTPQRFLREVIDSVLQQTYGRLELVLADGSTDPAVGAFVKKQYAKDRRVRYVKLAENRGISRNTNEAIRKTKGDFIVFTDHDDVLAVDALYEMAKAIEAQPGLDAIYTDEDKINRSGTAYFGPHFKPDFSMAVRRTMTLCCAVRNRRRRSAIFRRCSTTGGHIRHRRQATPRARSMRLMQGEGQSKHTISGAGSQPGQRRLRCAEDTAVGLRFRECRLSRS